MEDEGHPALEEHRLIRFDEGKLTRHQIDMMIINGIKRNESRIDLLFKMREHERLIK